MQLTLQTGKERASRMLEGISSLFQIEDTSSFNLRASGILASVSGNVFLFLTWEAMTQSLVLATRVRRATAFAFSINGSANNFLAGWDWNF